jgi:hypothetical protein
MGLAIAFVGTKVQAEFFLPQIIRAVDIAQQRQLGFAGLFAPGFDLGDLVGQQILMAHNHHRYSAPAVGLEPFANPLGIVTRSVDHKFAADIALFSMHDPFAVFTADAGCRAKSHDFRTHIARTLGQGLGQLRRVNIPICRVKKRALQIVGFKEGIAVLGLYG